MTEEEITLLQVHDILNRPGITWKERISLLWRMGFTWEQAKELVGPEKASDY